MYKEKKTDSTLSSFRFKLLISFSLTVCFLHQFFGSLIVNGKKEKGKIESNRQNRCCDHAPKHALQITTLMAIKPFSSKPEPSVFQNVHFSLTVS